MTIITVIGVGILAALGGYSLGYRVGQMSVVKALIESNTPVMVIDAATGEATTYRLTQDPRGSVSE